jgi:hypothetical protein
MATPACKLCGASKALCNSHIIPEFCFAPFYDEKHRFIEVTDVSAGRVTRPQKGFREPLLCSGCEALISRYERHARRLFVDPLPVVALNEARTREHERIDYALLKLFVLSVIWRASVSKLRVFKHVDLGPHEQLLGDMLLAGDPGQAGDYPVVIWVLHFQRERMPDLMTEPTYMRIDGLKCYRLMMTGFIFFVFVSKQNPSSRWLRLAIAPDKPVTTYDIELSEVGFLREVWNRVAETTKDVHI